MHRYLPVLSLGLALFVAGCGDKEPAPADFPTTPDAGGNGTPGALSPVESNPPTVPESPKNTVVPDIKEPKPEETAPTKDVNGNPEAASFFNAEELDAIHELPADQQALAIKQQICPISGEHLGSMDKPVAMQADGKTVFLCCGSCKKEFQSDPKSAIAKLPKN